MIYVPQIAEFFRQLSKQSWQIQNFGRFYSRAWRIYFDGGIKEILEGFNALKSFGFESDVQGVFSGVPGPHESH